ncbi:hypothetical protein, conserved [Entamoeba dispar SAW760]|uniref:Uncharacterized protein n=1 Tax=Entamoeba dispar (strain ATCC PRA-260 / SAW760) TaxID=370354 RepID=B0E8K6_ENTDS|nr:uncharacterized protein EDI_127150 [Entamoeba dispar SAW760]EDR29149.1 hypothetical protein, conserved [Entamoeba dispar SAW760]|eukprot:EDR29149.1 hypothetical protein, conserved [Entamoeba dispar SAW760]
MPKKIIKKTIQLIDDEEDDKKVELSIQSNPFVKRNTKVHQKEEKTENSPLQGLKLEGEFFVLTKRQFKRTRDGKEKIVNNEFSERSVPVKKCKKKKITKTISFDEENDDSEFFISSELCNSQNASQRDLSQLNELKLNNNIYQVKYTSEKEPIVFTQRSFKRNRMNGEEKKQIIVINQEPKRVKKTKVIKKSCSENEEFVGGHTIITQKPKLENVFNSMVFSSFIHNHATKFTKKGRKIAQKIAFNEMEIDVFKSGNLSTNSLENGLCKREVEVICQRMFKRDRKTGELKTKIQQKIENKGIKKIIKKKVVKTIRQDDLNDNNFFEDMKNESHNLYEKKIIREKPGKTTMMIVDKELYTKDEQPITMAHCFRRNKKNPEVEMKFKYGIIQKELTDEEQVKIRKKKVIKKSVNFEDSDEEKEKPKTSKKKIIKKTTHFNDDEDSETKMEKISVHKKKIIKKTLNFNDEENEIKEKITEKPSPHKKKIIKKITSLDDDEQPKKETTVNNSSNMLKGIKKVTKKLNKKNSKKISVSFTRFEMDFDNYNDESWLSDCENFSNE